MLDSFCSSLPKFESKFVGIKITEKFVGIKITENRSKQIPNNLFNQVTA